MKRTITATALAVLFLATLTPVAGAGAPIVIEDAAGDGGTFQAIAVPVNEPVLDILKTTISSDDEFFIVEHEMAGIGDPTVPPPGSTGYRVRFKGELEDELDSVTFYVDATRDAFGGDVFSLASLDEGATVTRECECEGEFDVDASIVRVKVPLASFAGISGVSTTSGNEINAMQIMTFRALGPGPLLSFSADEASEDGAVFVF